MSNYTVQELRNKAAAARGKISRLQKQYKRLRDWETEEKEELKEVINRHIAEYNQYNRQIKTIV